MALVQLQSAPESVRRFLSLWPPVGPIERPAMNMRGPLIRPDSTAVLIPQSAPPASRTVVKPRPMKDLRRSVARAAIKVSGMPSRRLI